MEGILSAPESAIPDLSRLNKSQRALLAARQVEQFGSDAKQRQKAGVRVENGIKGKAAELAAKKFGVSTRSVQLALSVLRHQDSDLLKQVERGEVSIHRAAEIVKLQPRALPHLQRLLRLRARAYHGVAETDQWVQDWLEALQSKGSSKPLEEDRPAGSEYVGMMPCPRCPGGPIDDCPICHCKGYIEVP